MVKKFCSNSSTLFRQLELIRNSFSGNNVAFVFRANTRKKSAYSLKKPWEIRNVVSLSYYLPCKFLRCFNMFYFLCLICSIFTAFGRLFPLQISPLIILISSVLQERSLHPRRAYAKHPDISTCNAQQTVP